MRRPIIDETKPYDPYEPYEIGKVDKKKKRTDIIVCLCAMLFCSIFVIVSLVIYMADRKKAGQCTEKLTAIVCENRPRKSSDSGSVTYQPIFEYTYEGHKYITGSNTSSSPPAFSEGEEVELYIDPDDPTKIYVPNDRTTLVICLIFGGIGGLSMLITVIAFIIIVKNRNKPDEELVEMKYY